jgi:cell wall-associated NlpC family hydrolase
MRSSVSLRQSFSLATALASSLVVLSGCGMLPSWTQSTPAPVATRVGAGETASDRRLQQDASRDKAHDVVLFALGLVETGYRFGGKNPEAGLDCSGMVSYVFNKAADVKLTGSAADLAKRGKIIPVEELRPGDLVFFNTRNKPYSHVGIYIGDKRFVHAPNSRGKVRTESLKSGWFAARFEEARTYFD